LFANCKANGVIVEQNLNYSVCESLLFRHFTETILKILNYGENKYQYELKLKNIINKKIKTLSIQTCANYPNKRHNPNIVTSLSRRNSSITSSPILVKEMCVPLDLLQSTVRAGVLLYILIGHQCPYHLQDVEHFGKKLSSFGHQPHPPHG
jgi:hypothetical protein